MAGFRIRMVPDIEIQVEEVPGVSDAIILRIRGELDTPTLPQLRSKLASIKSENWKRIALDLEGVSYANSTSLGTMVKEGDELSSAGGELIILKPQPKVELVMDMLGLSQFFKVFKSEEEAITYLGGVPAKPERKAGKKYPTTSISIRPPTTKAVKTTPFPLQTDCPFCRISIQVPAAGRYACPRCHQLFHISEDGALEEIPLDRVPPLEVATDMSGGSLRAYDAFIENYLSEHGVPQDTIASVLKAIKDIRPIVVGLGYDGDTKRVFSTLIMVRDGEVTARLSHAGRTITDTQAQNVIEPLAEELDEVVMEPHPVRGNIFRLRKKFTTEES